MRALVEGDPFAGSFWPLTLELSHLSEGDKKWTESSTVGVLRVLHDAKVSIIDWDALPKVFTKIDADDGSDSPTYAIEDYGSDYGEDGESEDEEPTISGEVAPPPKPPFDW